MGPCSKPMRCEGLQRQDPTEEKKTDSPYSVCEHSAGSVGRKEHGQSLEVWKGQVWDFQQMLDVQICSKRNGTPWQMFLGHGELTCGCWRRGIWGEGGDESRRWIASGPGVALSKLVPWKYIKVRYKEHLRIDRTWLLMG